MPSDTFLRLPEEKKKRLLDSAIHEFSRVTYHEASINVMIEKAEISRGSFYQYFKDKEDIYQYILASHQKYMLEILEKNVIKYEGDLKYIFFHFFEEVILEMKESEYRDFLRNVFFNLNTSNAQFFVPQHQGQKKYPNLDFLLEKTDFTKLSISSSELEPALDIILHITIPLMMKAIVSDIPIEQIKQEYQLKLEMICNGIYRKEHDVC